jgi:hypothetical protein
MFVDKYESVAFDPNTRASFVLNACHISRAFHPLRLGLPDGNMEKKFGVQESFRFGA